MDTLIARGVPGDYMFHVIAYSFFGTYSVILVQILVSLVAVIYVYRLAELLFSNPVVSAIAAISYIFLPRLACAPTHLGYRGFL